MDVCSTGYTTITRTIITTIPCDQTSTYTVPQTISVTVCTNCGPSPTTVTLTKPIVESSTSQQSQTSPTASGSTESGTSTVYTTAIVTVTKCPPSVSNCPADSQTTEVITKTIPVSTTAYPVNTPASETAPAQFSPVPVTTPVQTTTVQVTYEISSTITVSTQATSVVVITKGSSTEEITKTYPTAILPTTQFTTSSEVTTTIYGTLQTINTVVVYLPSTPVAESTTPAAESSPAESTTLAAETSPATGAASGVASSVTPIQQISDGQIQVPAPTTSQDASESAPTASTTPAADTVPVPVSTIKIIPSPVSEVHGHVDSSAPAAVPVGPIGTGYAPSTPTTPAAATSPIAFEGAASRLQMGASFVAVMVAAVFVL